MSGLAKTFHKPRSVKVVPDEGTARNRSLAVGCCSVAGKSSAVRESRLGMAKFMKAPLPWPGIASYSF